uniref:flavin reductase n=1 Tax=Nocardia cyriacigeorgica TaxID=135487 RepID=UPI002457F440
VEQRIPIGDHTFVVGRVTRVHDATEEKPAAAPLLYHNGRYHRPTPLPHPAHRPPGVFPRAGAERDGERIGQGMFAPA